MLGRQVVNQKDLGLCNAVILAEPQASFLKRWHSEYRSFRSNGHDIYWDEHSVQLPNKLSKQFPDEVTVLPPFAFFWPTFDDADLALIFDSPKPIDLSPAYATHLWESLAWERYLEHLTPGRVRVYWIAIFTRWVRPMIAALPDDYGAATISSRFARSLRRLKRRVRSVAPRGFHAQDIAFGARSHNSKRPRVLHCHVPVRARSTRAIWTCADSD